MIACWIPHNYLFSTQPPLKEHGRCSKLCCAFQRLTSGDSRRSGATRCCHWLAFDLLPVIAWLAIVFPSLHFFTKCHLEICQNALAFTSGLFHPSSI